MAETQASSIFDATSALGLVDTRVLKQLRKQSLEKAAIMRQNKLSGTDYANAEVGALMGRGLRALLGKAGILKDEDMEKAQSVDKARTRARSYISSLPEEIRASDPIEASIQERQALLDELSAAGLHQEADIVRGQILDLKKQGLEFSKLQADTTNAQVSAEGKALDNAYARETYDYRVDQQRAESALSGTNAAVALSTAGYKIDGARVDYEAAVEKLSQDRAMNPLLRQTAAADAAVRSLEASVGGSLPSLVKLQMARDHTMQYLAEHPEDVFAKKRLQELNEQIQTDAKGITRQGPLDLTTAVRTDTQRDIIQAQGFTEQLNTILQQLETSEAEPFGGAADLRRGAAGVVSQAISLVGAPQSLASNVGNFMYTNEEIDVSSKARQLKADIINWLSSGSRAGSTDVETAGELLQVLDNPSVDKRQAMIALTNLSNWMVDKQMRLWNVIEAGQVQNPNGTGDPYADGLNDFLNPQGTGGN